MLKRTFRTAAAMLTAMAIFAGCKGTPDTTNSDLVDQLVENDAAAAANANWLPNVDIHNFIMPEPGEKIAVMTVKDYGEIKIKLFPEDADKGVENFIGLAEMGYYDELIFHRVIPEFMIQGGDPKGNGTGGKCIWGDKFEGGTSENLYHFTGAVAYANSGATSTNGSQFYIVNTPDGYMSNTCEELHSYYPEEYNWPENVVDMYNEKGGVPFLDGGYTVFGQVFEGIDVVRAIAQVETDQDPENDIPDDKPLTPVIIESVRIVEYEG